MNISHWVPWQLAVDSGYWRLYGVVVQHVNSCDSSTVDRFQQRRSVRLRDTNWPHFDPSALLPIIRVGRLLPTGFASNHRQHTNWWSHRAFSRPARPRPSTSRPFVISYWIRADGHSQTSQTRLKLLKRASPLIERSTDVLLSSISHVRLAQMLQLLLLLLLAGNLVCPSWRHTNLTITFTSYTCTSVQITSAKTGCRDSCCKGLQSHTKQQNIMTNRKLQ